MSSSDNINQSETEDFSLDGLDIVQKFDRIMNLSSNSYIEEQTAA